MEQIHLHGPNMWRVKTNLEFHAVPKSLLSNKRALLCFMISLSRRYETFSSPEFSSFADKLPCGLYCAIVVINTCLAALYNGRRISVEMPNLWSLFQKLEIPSFDCSKGWLDEDRTPPASSFRMKNWDGWINPTSSLEESKANKTIFYGITLFVFRINKLWNFQMRHWWFEHTQKIQNSENYKSDTILVFYFQNKKRYKF